jgi:hypothetical protein
MRTQTKSKIEAIENGLPPKQQLLNRLQQQEEYLQARMKEPIEADLEAEPFPTLETWIRELDARFSKRLKDRPADEIRRARRQMFAELAFLLDIQGQLEEFVKTETSKIRANLLFFVRCIVPLMWRVDISSPHREHKPDISINASRQQRRTAIAIADPMRIGLCDMQRHLDKARSVIQKVAVQFFDGHVPLLSLTVESLDFVQKEVAHWVMELGFHHFMDDGLEETAEKMVSDIEAEVSDVVGSMRDNAEIAMYKALGEPNRARSKASKQLKQNLQAIDHYLEQLGKELRVTQNKR